MPSGEHSKDRSVAVRREVEVELGELRRALAVLDS